MLFVITTQEISKVVGEWWSKTPEEEKEKYVKMAAEDKERYHKALSAYNMKRESSLEQQQAWVSCIKFKIMRAWRSKKVLACFAPSFDVCYCTILSNVIRNAIMDVSHYAESLILIYNPLKFGMESEAVISWFHCPLCNLAFFTPLDCICAGSSTDRCVATDDGTGRA